MKKYFLYTLIASLSAFGFTSCNNGDYDANPEADNSDLPNPLNPKNQPGVMLGSMSAVINGEWKGFPEGYFLDSTSVDAIIGVYYDGDWAEYIQITFDVNGFQGPGTYRHNDTVQQIGAAYLKGDASKPLEMEVWATGFTVSQGNFELNISDEGDDRYRGTFSGIFYKYKDFEVDTTQRIEVTDGKFFMKKVSTLQ